MKLAVTERIQTMMKEPVPVDPGNHYPGPDEERIVRDVPVHAEVEEAMPVCTHVEDATPYDSWVRLSEAQQYMPLDHYTMTEMMQLRSVNIPFHGVPN